MTQHYSKNTVEVTHWCNRCKKATQWTVSNGLLGSCKNDHHQAEAETKKPREDEPKQIGLFGDNS